MLPHSAADILRVVRYERMSELERRYGAHIARDIETDAVRRNDRDREDYRRTLPVRLAFLRGVALARNGW
jgi:hypothetical protein